MHVLIVADHSAADMRERWEKFGIRSWHVVPNELMALLEEGFEHETFLVDAFVLISEPLLIPATASSSRTPVVINLPSRIRSLPENVAMADGRRWSALPIIVFGDEVDLQLLTDFAAHLTDVGYRDIQVRQLSETDNYGVDTIKQMIKKYRQEVLDELDNLGFIVAYEGGRYRLGPALKPRPELVGYYYFGAADQRRNHYVTVDRDLLGIQYEIELLEALLNNARASEADFQKFFEDNPHFLSTVANALPHVQLRDNAGKLLVPDFILKPIVASQRDSRWEVLDLKRPDVPLLAGKGSRRRLSQAVQQAIRQLRDYGDYFANPNNSTAVELALGHDLRRPKLGVLIGRMTNLDVEALELEQGRLPDIRIITYDEILEQQRVML